MVAPPPLPLPLTELNLPKILLIMENPVFSSAAPLESSDGEGKLGNVSFLNELDGFFTKFTW